jgi:hypothetical protein
MVDYPPQWMALAMVIGAAALPVFMHIMKMGNRYQGKVPFIFRFASVVVGAALGWLVWFVYTIIWVAAELCL